MSKLWSSTGTSPHSGQSHEYNHDHDHDDARHEVDIEKGLSGLLESLPKRPTPAYFETNPTTSVNTEGHLPQTSPTRPEKSMPALHHDVTKSILRPPNSTNEATSHWILFHLWFNTYRKFFILCTSLNLAAMIAAGFGRFPYAVEHSGAMVLGNLLFAVLVRNELFLRLLYLVTIYGLRSVCRNILDLWCACMLNKVLSSGLRWRYGWQQPQLCNTLEAFTRDADYRQLCNIIPSPCGNYS